MTEWFQESFHDSSNLSFSLMATRLVLAFVLGCVVAGVYVLTQRKPQSSAAPLASTIVLLTILIAMVMLIIGNSVARAFSLAGALAIIRFRTIVHDTRDTAFVIFAVVVGMGVGAGHVVVALAGIPVVAAAAVMVSFLGRSSAPSACDYSLVLRMGIGRDPAEVLAELFDKYLVKTRLKETITARQGAALDLTYDVQLRREVDAMALVAELNQVEGVQSVELRQR